MNEQFGAPQMFSFHQIIQTDYMYY